MIEKEVFDEIQEEFLDAQSAMRLANRMVCRVRLKECCDRILKVGICCTQMRDETRPFNQMDEQCLGLSDARALAGCTLSGRRSAER